MRWTFRATRDLPVLAAAGVFVLGCAIALAWALVLMSGTPEVQREHEALETTVIYARGGEVLAGIYEEDRIWVELDEIPRIVQQAFIAVEDRNFHSHGGVDPFAIARAAYANIRHGDIVEGGSTITQQLARNLYLDRRQTIERKLQEMRIALALERTHDKDTILEMYLNHIYLGAGAYGVQAASQRYFDCDVDELTVDQAALLAALPRAPHHYSPLNDAEAARGRRNLVLQRMSQNNYLTEEEAAYAADRPLEIKVPQPEPEIQAAWFVEHVRRKLLDLFDEGVVYGEGLVVRTTLDVDAQAAAVAAAEKAIAVGHIPTRSLTDDGQAQPQYALVSLEVHGGAIRSMIGGRGGDEYNRAVQSARHPGSAFKPFIYAAALTLGRQPDSVVNDIPRIDREAEGNQVVWPRNFDDLYRGLVTYRRALARSINTAAVEVVRQVGVERAREHVDQYGFTTLTDRDGTEEHYSFALGGLERGVSPLEMAAAYGAFASGGTAVQPYAITEVTDRDGRILYEAPPTAEPDPVRQYHRFIRPGLTPSRAAMMRRRRVLSEEQALLMTDMLRSVVADGTGTAARLPVPAAGKTGTSDRNHDAWFAGYARGLVSAVWIGEDSPEPMRYRSAPDGTLERSEEAPRVVITGVHASMVWGDYMRRLLAKDKRTHPAIDLLGHPPADTPLVPTDLLPGWTHTRTWRGILRMQQELPGPVEETEIDLLTGVPVLPEGVAQSLGVEYEPFLTVTRRSHRDTGIVVGPIEIELEPAEDLVTEEGEPFAGTYLVGDREPVQRIDPETGLPVDARPPAFERITDGHEPAALPRTSRARPDP